MGPTCNGGEQERVIQIVTTVLAAIFDGSGSTSSETLFALFDNKRCLVVAGDNGGLPLRFFEGGMTTCDNTK